MSGPIRSAMHLANANALLWAVGNGLVSTTLVIYLAAELGAVGIVVSFILAAPRFAGLLRLATPLLVRSGTQRKNVCTAGYLASSGTLFAMPLLATPLGNVSPVTGMVALVGCWCVYHLLEYIATIALWSWLGDWMPSRVRGRLVGWRERYLVAGRIVGIVGSVLLSFAWNYISPGAPVWQPFAWSALLGALLMALAVLPLLWLAPKNVSPRRDDGQLLDDLTRALLDPAYRQLLLYSCWFALANGVTGVAQSLYPQRVLGFDYHSMVGLRSTMYAGQTLLTAPAGRWVDRFGARWLLTASQLVVATGPLFFLCTSPEQPWWVLGAFIVWMAYAPLNVGLDTLKLKLSPTDDRTPSLSVYYALSDVVSGVTLLAGGYWFDRLTTGDGDAMSLYATLFMVGWVLRTIAAGLAWRVDDCQAPLEK